MTTTKRNVTLQGVGTVEISLEEYGDGLPCLLLHGGGGPETVTRFGAAMAEAHRAQVFAPIHPGFALTPRPVGLDTMKGLARLYLALIESLGLEDVTVIGNSIGGWITAEIALLESSLLRSIVLIDAVGIDVPDHPVADFFTLGYDDFLQRAFKNPEPFRRDPATLPEEAQKAVVANREALATYTGRQMNDPDLAGRLGTLDIPALVLWGESDRIADPEYGRAYAASIPTSRFEIIEGAGHLPQVENPGRTIDAVWEFAEGGFEH